DLDWMKRVGIGGVQNFDASLGTPQVVEKRLAYMTPEWQDAFRYAVDRAQENGLEVAIATSSGWSETGGPWVTPEQAMKKLVWSETEVAGGRELAAALPRPSGVAGPFQDAPMQPAFDGPPRPTPDFYRDISVIAYEMPPHIESSRAVARIGTKVIDAALLTDGALTNGVAITPGTDAESCIAFDYPKPERMASLRLALRIGADFFRSPLAMPVLESSLDGASFRKVADVPSGNLIQHTVSFPAVTARYFRVCFTPPPKAFTDLLDAAAPGADMAGPLGPPGGGASAGVAVLELRLLPNAQIHRFEEKAAFAFVPDYYAIPTPPVEPGEAIPQARVIDLTSRMSADGKLRWMAPKGRWRVLRFGYSLTGQTNHPATEEATGLEVDKLDRARVKAYLDTYLAGYEKVLGPSRIGAQGLRALLVDSIEVGPQNWTESLPLEFKSRRGYDLTPWMPTLAGVIVGSAADSERFLYDFRRTLAELISDSHYAQIADSARSRGLIQYGEALEQGRPVLGDDMEMRRHASIPMAAMWTFTEKSGAPPTRYADIRGAASVAHIYGQNLVAAESLTSAFAPWNFAPRDLRPMIDLEFVLGVNRPVIHTSVHQPLTDKAPGLSLAIFGQYFNRNESWAEQAGPWVSYLSRTAYLLQQGRFAADVLYFYGEEAPLTALFGERTTSDAPTGYGFDFANTDVLLNRVQVRDGALVTETGMRYRVLWLGGSSSRMTLPVLKRLAALVSEGATVVGSRPIESPSLTDDPKEFQSIAAGVWSKANADSGRVLSGTDVNTA
ncbi:MAG TPA: glycosyl hydrolase, partial [Steroidobacteraceae bacterium]|nr:glycosyl hydrolase [Steroidobacteraceae bacterium]